MRLGGLYALERLAQDHPEQRQTIVNVLCAYLRMPYTLPSDMPVDDTDDKLIGTYRKRAQEREARLTAQRILATHLHPGNDPEDPQDTFWKEIDLDLTGATLIDLDLANCTIRTTRFDKATFIGTAGFSGATFTNNASFHETTFTGTAGFHGVTFTGTAGFHGVTFTGHARFHKTVFTGHVSFNEATFTGHAEFSRTTFTGHAGFRGTTLPPTRYIGTKTPPSPWTNFIGARFELSVPAKVTRFVTAPEDETGSDPQNR
ncbi:pentapeptide repeat-containing protein [Actinokineospora sp. 24-640]